MTEEKKPWKDSLWMGCLFELYAKAEKEGEEKVVFAKVDELVIEKSKIIFKYEVEHDSET